jgi:glutathione S-transferase
MSRPILYSFRRCPYAMRARLAIAVSGIQVELREILLKDKPQAMLNVSPKGTVPVLITADDQVIDESNDIMIWALQQSDPDHWLCTNPIEQELTTALITKNDHGFKHFLDRYKYADRFPENTELYYRQQAELTLSELEQKLSINSYLLNDRLTLADMALLPFIRQFAFVDKTWFDAAPYPKIQAWLDQFINSALFDSMMVKLTPWQQDDDAIYFSESSSEI